MPTKRADVDTDYVVQRYTAGASLKAIAQGVGVSVATIVRVLRDAGTPTRSPLEANRQRVYEVPPRRPDIDSERVIADYQAGASGFALAQQWQTDASTIRRIL